MRSAMTMSDNRQCPLPTKHVRDKSRRRRCSLASRKTQNLPSPSTTDPSRASSVSAVRFIGISSALPSPLPPKCVRSASFLSDLRHNHRAHTYTRARTPHCLILASQPASLASDVFKGVCVCMCVWLKGRFLLLPPSRSRLRVVSGFLNYNTINRAARQCIA